MAKCFFCKNEVEELPVEETAEMVLGTKESNPKDLAQVHDECMLDYFAWLKRRNRPLDPEKPWTEKAKQLFAEVDSEYRSKYYNRDD